MSSPFVPVPPTAPLPHRREIRGWLLALATRRTGWPVLLLAFDWLLLAAALAGVLLVPPLWLKLLCGAAAGFVIGRLFIVGHDACHQSLTPHRRLNQWLGRIALLPSLTPYSLWEVGHNVVHHGYTNLKGFDFVWAPYTREEFAALSPVQQRAAPHHGTHGAPRGHGHPAVPPEEGPGRPGTHAAGAHRGAALLLALVLRHGTALQAVRIRAAVLDGLPGAADEPAGRRPGVEPLPRAGGGGPCGNNYPFARFCRISNAGSVLPSSTSRKAPPPVEM